ncbi:hypothetical protein AKG98_732 [Moritella sp. JT01]|uniref:hypothetical protein n=1 Tax=Moritella sp. JT01 TaxID=756698 RepID=UPI000792C0AF|nr:hypothetical protein [Moritella sp. JT01]KXO10889.1 hypothetical protein AKG98_732 [Moritella sp. JT01]
MKKITTVALLATALSGCGSGSTPTDPVKPPTTPVNPPTAPVNPPTAPVNPPTAPVNPPTAPVNPKADYVFSSDKLDKLKLERQEIQKNAMTLTYNGVRYDKIEFAEEISDSEKLIRLTDNSGSKNVDLYLPDAEDNENCIIYAESKILGKFNCDANIRSISNDTTLINTTTINKNLSVSLEYNNEMSEYVTALGNTILTESKNGNKVTITTSFAFSDFYRDFIPGVETVSTLGASTYFQLSDIVTSNLGSKMTLKFNNHIGGSADDDINMYTGLMINSNKMTTIVTSTGSVFSGGTDLFAAGNPRILQRSDTNKTIELNKQVGVHSWAQGDKTAKEFPYTNESHRKQATYFNKVMGNKGVDFYIFTLDSAPANGAHWITKADSDKYDFITRIE